MINLSLFKPVWHFCKKHATKLLAGLAIGSEAAALYLTAKEAPRAKEKLDALDEDATKMEKFKTVAPGYAKAGVAATVSFAAIILECVVGERQKAMIAGALSLSQAAAAKYQQALLQKTGDREAIKAAERENCAEAMRQNPANTANIFATGKGDQLIFEPLSGRYFTSDWNEVEKAVIRLNKSIYNNVWVKANEWFAEIGLEDVGLGESSGWNGDHMLDIGSTAMKTLDGRSCLAICYYNRPIRYK